MDFTCLNGVITAPINDGCPIPFQGFEDTAYIFNKSQIGTLTYDRGTGIVSAFVMKTGAIYKGYAVKDDSDKPFGSLKVSGEKKPYMIVFNKELKLAVIGNSASVISTVNTLTKGEYVMLLKQIGVDTQDKYYLVGVESPLRFDASTFEASSDIFGHEVTLKEINAASVGMILRGADAAATDAIFDSLVDNVATV